MSKMEKPTNQHYTSKKTQKCSIEVINYVTQNVLKTSYLNLRDFKIFKTWKIFLLFNYSFFLRSQKSNWHFLNGVGNHSMQCVRFKIYSTKLAFLNFIRTRPKIFSNANVCFKKKGNVWNFLFIQTDIFFIKN